MNAPEHNPGEPQFGEHEGGEHNPGEPEFGEQGTKSQGAHPGRGAGTSPPPEAQNQATTPPGNADRDEAAIERAEEKLDQAAGGH